MLLGRKFLGPDLTVIGLPEKQQGLNRTKNTTAGSN